MSDKFKSNIISEIPGDVKNLIINIRGKRVILDVDLAKLYGTKTKRLNEQIKRNRNRFPEDFMFSLTSHEKAEVVANCDHLTKLKYSATLPFAFTEYGVVMAANVLNSQIAIDASVLVVRAFIHARELLAEHFDLKRRLDALERKVSKGFHENEEELQAIRYAIHQLMFPPEPKKKHPLGF